MVWIGAKSQFMVPSHRRRRLTTGNSRRQIERFGKFSHTATPGLSFAIPIIDEIAYKRSLKETTIAIHPQTAITKDNVHVHLDGAVYTRVVDAYKASYGIEDPEGAITTLAQSAMRKEVGNLELDQLFLEREKLNQGIAHALDEASQPWGIRVRNNWSNSKLPTSFLIADWAKVVIAPSGSSMP